MHEIHRQSIQVNKMLLIHIPVQMLTAKNVPRIPLILFCVEISTKNEHLIYFKYFNNHRLLVSRIKFGETTEMAPIDTPRMTLPA